MAQLGKELRLSDGFFEPVKFEIAAKVDVLGDEPHLHQSFLDLLDAVSQEDALLQVVFKLYLHASLWISCLQLRLFTITA